MAGFKNGTLLRMAGGFGDVLTEEGGEVRCRIRGKFKQNEESLLVGDRVRISLLDSYEGVIEEILPRRNRIFRPSVANLDQMVAVMSAREPFPDWILLSRQLVQAERCGIGSLICVNKVDLLHPEEKEGLQAELELLPYRYLFITALSGKGISTLENKFKNNTSVLAGPSGVGKSTLLNAIQPGLKLETAEVSPRINRGKHTTRLVELFKLDTGGLVVDTPGFSKLKVLFNPANINYEDLRLAEYFPEIKDLSQNCKFRDCLHQNEPGCMVKEAAEKGLISMRRYGHYLQFLKEIRREQEKRMR